MHSTDIQLQSGRAFFWIPTTDESGNPVDTRFTEAAYARAQLLRCYRSTELRDEAVRANLVELAVYRCSRANSNQPISDPAAYFFKTFQRLVDDWIARDRRVEHRPDDQLEQVRQSGTSREVCRADMSVALREALEMMDEVSRFAWSRRLAGFPVKEIARELDMTPEGLSARLHRAIVGITEKLRSAQRNKRQ